MIRQVALDEPGSLHQRRCRPPEGSSARTFRGDSSAHGHSCNGRRRPMSECRKPRAAFDAGLCVPDEGER